MTTTKHADPVRALVTLVEELCDSVDANAEGIGGSRPESTILREIGPLIKPAQEALRALPEPISSRELIKRCGGDPDAPFVPGPFPPEMREPSPLLREPREFAPDKGLGKREDWAIDTHSTPSPILTYQSCSVIEGDQAHELLRLVEREIAARDSDPKAPPPAIVEKYAEPLKRLAKKIEAMPLDVLREHLREFYAEASAIHAENESAEAKIGRDFLGAIEAARSSYPWLSDWAPAEHYGELIGDLLDIAFPDPAAVAEKRAEAEVFVRNYLLERDEACGFLHPEDAADPEDERKESAREIVEHVVSGEAGAGPVRCSSCDGTGDLIRVDGEWIGWCPCGAASNAGAGPVTPEDRAEQYIQAAIDRAPEPLRRLGEWLANKLDEDDWKTAERMLLGAATAHPVEEPGEAERLRRELDEARALVDECCEARDGAGFLGSVPDCIEWLKDERAAAETALAETRERLEKTEAALRRIAVPLDCGCVPCTGRCRSAEALEIEVEERQALARAALSTQESSAALACDGQEKI